MPMMKIPIDQLVNMNLNRYEAVIVASQHARHLNSRRLKQLALLEQNPDVQIDGRKVTMLALRDLLDQKVKFGRTDTI